MGPSQGPRRSPVLARVGHIHLSNFGPKKPIGRDIILMTTRRVLHAVVVCVGGRFGPTRRRGLAGERPNRPKKWWLVAHAEKRPIPTRGQPVVFAIARQRRIDHLTR